MRLLLSILAAMAPEAVEGLLNLHNISSLPGHTFENLAVRSNGQILTTTTFPQAQLYQVDPFMIRPPVLVATFPHLQYALGIYELQPDIFYVATGNLTDPSKSMPQTLDIFRVDMQTFFVTANGSVVKAAVVKKITTIPHGILLNGITSVPDQGIFILVADSLASTVWRVDVVSGEVSPAFQNPTLAPVNGSAGLNGVKVFENHLYYTNTATANIYKLPINSNGYVDQDTTPLLLAHNPPGDDLVLDARGNIYVASPSNELFMVTPQGEKSVIASITSPTAARFGRLDSDAMSLYVTSDGGFLARIDLFELAQ